jgi:CheY-like chemotaxis protein
MPKILLVEDNEMNRDMLARRLQRKGFSVIIAADGVDALNMAKSETPDLILMDLGLPVLDGWRATQLIKASENTKNIPVIALTAHAMNDEQEQAFQIGCDDYDVKPVDLPRLLVKIDALLKRNAAS